MTNSAERNQRRGSPRANDAFGAERTFIALALLDTVVIGLSVRSRRMIENRTFRPSGEKVDQTRGVKTFGFSDVPMRCSSCIRLTISKDSLVADES